MADLRSILKPKSSTPKDSTVLYIGMKMNKTEGWELAKLVGLEQGAKGTDIFKSMLLYILDKEGIE